MKTVIILKGLPASGKSTWAREKTRTDGTFKRINKDDLRAMLDDGLWSKENEKFVLRVRDNIILRAIKDGFNVIVDDTNLHEKHEEAIRALVKDIATVEIREFDVSVEECIERDAGREKPVGEEVIRQMGSQFIPRKKYEPKVGTKKAIMVDIDGTLAKMHNRGPYDWFKVYQDKVNEPIAQLVRTYHNLGYEIVVMSGRDEVCFDDTEKWLDDNNIPYNILSMRPQGDKRKDSIVKQELFDKYVHPNYTIEFVLDDRNQVVSMWRSLGLTCLQVDDGNF
jgi:predicted kinase